MKNMDAQIARHILAAQLASDEAKSDWEQSAEWYALKDYHIIKALELVSMSHSAKFRFAVQDGRLGYHSSLVYFTYKDGRTRCQVSFHNFSAEVMKYDRPSARTHWDEGDSRESAYSIARLFGAVKDARRDVFH